MTADLLLYLSQAFGFAMAGYIVGWAHKAYARILEAAT